MTEFASTGDRPFKVCMNCGSGDIVKTFFEEGSDLELHLICKKCNCSTRNIFSYYESCVDSGIAELCFYCDDEVENIPENSGTFKCPNCGKENQMCSQCVIDNCVGCENGSNFKKRSK